MKLIIFLAVLATAVCALPSDDVIPEIAADVLLQTSSHEEASAMLANGLLLQTTAHAEASALLAKDGKNACTDMANAAEDEVRKSIAQHQKDLDKIDKGQDCKNKGQSEVASAENAKTKATSALKVAEDALNKAQKAKIDFGKFSFDQLSPGNCDQFFNSKVYKDAHAKKKAAEQARDKAVGALSGAKSAVKAAIKSAFSKSVACACKVRGLHQKSRNAANVAADKANIKLWTKAAHIKCVIAGTSAANCNVPALPKVKKVKVADLVTKASCGPNNCVETKNCLGGLLVNTGYTNGVGDMRFVDGKTGEKQIWSKFADNGWNSEVVSNSVVIKKGEGIEFQWSKPVVTNKDGNLMFGLDVKNSNKGYADIDYAWQMSSDANGNTMNTPIYERGTAIRGGRSQGNDKNQVLSIRWCKDNSIKYFINRKFVYKSGNLVYNPPVINGVPVLHIGNSFYTKGAAVKNIQRISFDDCMTAYPTFGKST